VTTPVRSPTSSPSPSSRAIASVDVTTQAQARALLGVGEHAGPEEVRRAYRRLARTHHPDAGGDAAEFHRLQQAVAVLLGDPARRPEPPRSSPSRSGVRRPSTATRVGGTGWGESRTRPLWHDDPVEVSRIDWSAPRPEPPHTWNRDRLAVATCAGTDIVDDQASQREPVPVHAVTGVSRKPGSRVNRLATWVATEFLSRWWIRPAEDRGRAGHDVEIRIDLPSRHARKLADQAPWPTGWTRERRPSMTVVTLVLTPSRDLRATALRAADALSEALDGLGWPLDDWINDGGQ
jgi:hypothetical protein